MVAEEKASCFSGNISFILMLMCFTLLWNMKNSFKMEAAVILASKSTFFSPWIWKILLSKARRVWVRKNEGKVLQDIYSSRVNFKGENAWKRHILLSYSYNRPAFVPNLEIRSIFWIFSLEKGQIFLLENTSRIWAWSSKNY